MEHTSFLPLVVPFGVASLVWLLMDLKGVVLKPGYQGNFDWLRRMGVHLAYHQSIANKAIHLCCICTFLFCTVQCVSRIEIVDGVDLSLVVIALLAPVYLRADFTIGLLYVSLLLYARAMALSNPFPLIPCALAIPGSFMIQTQIGHKRFEEAGRDDTERNIGELIQTRSPIPALLIFFYHLAELFFLAGYNPRGYSIIKENEKKELELLNPKGKDKGHAETRTTDHIKEQ